MENLKHKSLLKFNEVSCYKNNDANKLGDQFIFPASRYFQFLVGVASKTFDHNDNKKELKRIDDNNESLMYKEIMKYGEELGSLYDRGKTFGSQRILDRYAKTKNFYMILCKFILDCTTVFYYKNLYQIDKLVRENKTTDQGFETLFGDDSRGFDWSFDKAYSHALRLESAIRNEFKKIMDEEYEPINVEAEVKNNGTAKTHKNKKNTKK